MKARSTILLLYIAWLIAAVMLVFAAAEKQSDSFYNLLRWVCCVVFAYSAVTSFHTKRMLWLGIFAVRGIVCNPLCLLGLDGWYGSGGDALVRLAGGFAGCSF